MAIEIVLGFTSKKIYKLVYKPQTGTDSEPNTSCSQCFTNTRYSLLISPPCYAPCNLETVCFKAQPYLFTPSLSLFMCQRRRGRRQHAVLLKLQRGITSKRCHFFGFFITTFLFIYHWKSSQNPMSDFICRIC